MTISTNFILGNKRKTRKFAELRDEKLQEIRKEKKFFRSFKFKEMAKRKTAQLPKLINEIFARKICWRFFYFIQLFPLERFS